MHLTYFDIMILCLFFIMLHQIGKELDLLQISIHEKNIDIINLKNKYLYSKVVKETIHEICEIEEEIENIEITEIS